MPLYNPLSSTDTIGQSYEISNLGLATSVAASALTIALKQADGTTDPGAGASAVKVGMRSSTLTSGLYNQRSVATATSLVISSGSTLGHTSGNAHKIWVYLIDNAGTLELAASQTLYPETQLISTTAEGGAGAADSNRVIYSATARSSVPHRVIGLLTSTQTTAGTWATNMSQVQVGNYGGLSATEVVAARYYLASNTAFSTGTVQIPYDTKVYDTTNSYSTSTFKYTAPSSGWYRATITFNTTTSLTETVAYRIDATTSYFLGTSASTGRFNGSDTFYLNAGQTFEPMSAGSGGTYAGGDTGTFFTIERIK